MRPNPEQHAILREIAESLSRGGIGEVIACARNLLSGNCMSEFNLHGAAKTPQPFLRRDLSCGASLPRLIAAQQAICTLFLRQDAEPGERAWARLTLQFQSELRNAQGLSAESALEVCLRVGLSALKSNACRARPSRPLGQALAPHKRCPLCAFTPLNALAYQMPMSCATQSFLRCCLCYRGDISAWFSPCRHVCCCWECAMDLQVCPVCQAHITSVKRIYLL